jgi:uncharacterized protein (TIGR00255 family)
MSETIRRGHVEVFIQVDYMASQLPEIEVDWAFCDAVVDMLQKIKARYHIDDGIGLRDLILLPDIWQKRAPKPETAIWEKTLLETFKQSLQNLGRMRAEEGDHLLRELLDLHSQLQTQLEKIRAEDDKRLIEAKQKWRQRVGQILKQAALDENRLYTEVVLLLEKMDITEELARLDSHLKQFRNMAAEQGAIGRKLDFLIQEMNREINTIGSKANKSELAQDVVHFKSTLEKLREQVQNVE